MKIAIIADRLLMEEIMQNCIPAYVSYKLRASVECSCSFDSRRINEYEKLIIWQSLNDQACYAELAIACEEKLVRIFFKKEIRYAKEQNYDSSSRMSYSLKENPDFHTPSKYMKELRRGLKIALNI